MLPKYRIIFVGGVCHWQIQERHWMFFYKNKYLPFSSATTAGNEVIKLMASKINEGF